MSLLTKSFSFKCSSYSLPMNSLEDFLSVVINSKKKTTALLRLLHTFGGPDDHKVPVL